MMEDATTANDGQACRGCKKLSALEALCNRNFEQLFPYYLKRRSQPPKTVQKYADKLYDTMRADQRSQLSVSQAAKVLDLSVRRTRQLWPFIMKDVRFTSQWVKVRGQKKKIVIEIKQYIK